MDNTMQVFAIAEMFPNGQKTNAAAIKYDSVISTTSLDVQQFRVKDRAIVRAYANTEPRRAEEGTDGCYVILELSVKDRAADVVIDPPRTRPGPPPPKYRVVPTVEVQQIAPIRCADGRAFPPTGDFVRSTGSIEPVVDDFRISEYGGLKYNLFIPKDYDPAQKYPLVMFIADIGANGLDDRMALSQGIGGTVWATPEEQAKHPCFVLVPQFPFKPIMRDDFTFAPEFNQIKPLLDYVCDTYSIDRSRIYSTGQSQGGMAACELNVEYPELFAASLLVACQWDPEKMAERCVGQKYWILVSEIDQKASSGMNAVTEAMSAKGSTVKRFTWDAKAPREQLADKVSEALKEEADIRYTFFAGDSVIPEDDTGPNRLHHAHANTWPVAYDIEGVRDWLLAQRR